MIELGLMKNDLPLTNDQIQLVLFNEQDICEAYLHWLNDPETVRFSDQRFRTHTRENCLAYLNSFESTDGFFIAIKSVEGILLGTMSVYLNRNHDTADIGLLIGRESWGKGIGSQAWSLMLQYLITKGEVRKVTGGTLDCNIGMINIMKKSGMQPDGIRQAQQLVDDVPHDIVHFCKFRESVQ